MEYQKIINLLDNTPNQPTKFRTKNWVETNYDTHGTYNNNRQIKFKNLLLMWSLCHYSDAHKLASGTITAPNTGTVANPNNRKNMITKNCAPCTDCISEINNTQIDNDKDIDKVMLMYNLKEYSDNYSKTSECLWQYFRDEPFLTLIWVGGG